MLINRVYEIDLPACPEVTVIRITSNRLVAIPYDYNKSQWIDNPGKILDTKISR